MTWTVRTLYTRPSRNATKRVRQAELYAHSSSRFGKGMTKFSLQPPELWTRAVLYFFRVYNRL